MFERILTPLDGSALAESVLPYVALIAKAYGAGVILFHVVEKASPESIHGEHHLRAVDEAQAYLSEIARRLEGEGIEAAQDVHEVQEAGVAQTIREHAVELGADLIALCAHGKGGLRDMVYGSIAQQVIREGTTPVLCVRPGQGGESVAIRKILLPLDGSKAHEVAIPVAASLAGRLGAQVELITVTPTGETLPVRGAITGRLSARATAVSLDAFAAQAGEYLGEWTQELGLQGLGVEGVVRRGDVAEKLVEAVEGDGIDLVVLATHGHNAFDARWGGNVTPRFLPRSPAPVVLVRGAVNENRH